jgi:large subunit ribosomal protein L24
MKKHNVHVRKGDTVVVVSGKGASEGKRGKVLEVILSKGRVIVEGVNIVKRHSKPTRSLPQGGILEKEASMDSSNVMLYCTKCNKPTRIKKEILENGKKERVCRKCGEEL